MKTLIALFVLVLLSACASLGINFSDGTWSSCTYTNKDGTTLTGPLQLGGAPLEFTKPDGTKVKCVAIPKVE